jgi:DegV family protein with EDD domain
MKAFQIFSDSSCDLPDSLIDKHGIRLIPFYVSFDCDNYYRENIEISNDAFYEQLALNNSCPTTSMPSVQDYIGAFREALRDGLDILCICLSHKLSGSYQSAVNAKQILEEKYPERTIQITDSIQATAGQGLLLLQAIYMKEAGLSLSVIIDRFNIIKTTTRIMFSVDTLEYLEKGRRIGKAASLADDILDDKPLLLLEGAELVPYSSIKGRRKSLDAILEMTKVHFKVTEEQPSDYDFAIANATTMADAQYLKNRLEEYIGHEIVYPIFQIGVTIGTYTGPGGIGICFIKKYDHIERRDLSVTEKNIL